jgi:hypothetical protein
LPYRQWPVPSEDVIAKYNSGVSQSEGPTKEHFVIDWQISGITRWTRDCATLFAHEFCTQHEAGLLPLLPARMSITVAEVKHRVCCYVRYLKREYSLFVNREEDDDDETPPEKEVALQKSRDGSRRRQVSVSF